MILRKRSILPVMLIFAGTFLLVGCIYIPYFGSTGQQTATPNEYVTVLGGEPTEKRFQGQYQHRFKIGVTTREQVLAEMPHPGFVPLDQRFFVYLQSRADGYWVYPLCFFLSEPDGESYVIKLNFDDRGVLVSSTRGSNDMQRTLMRERSDDFPMPHFR